jgi:hypothetical protein
VSDAQCLVSTDARWLAVRSGAEVTLHDCGANVKEVGRARIVEGGTLMLIGGDLFDHVITGDRTIITTLAPPKLTVRSTIEIPGAALPRAVSPGCALLTRGAEALVLRVTGGKTAWAPILGVQTPPWVVGLEDDTFLAQGPKDLEVWDGKTRRALRRVHFQLERAAIAAGVGAAGVHLWLTDERPQLTTVRISDGKTGAIKLSAPPERPFGHLHSAWVIADLAGVPHAINLVTGAIGAMPCQAGTPRALIPRGTGATITEVVGTELLLWDVTTPQAEAAPGGPVRLTLETRKK